MVDEYHDPVGKSDCLSLTHLERYRFACENLKPGERVLDIACGPGYGSAMLLAHGCNVTGADYDGELVAAAQRAVPHGRFVAANALALPFDDGSFDAVVSFETIEHVRNGAAFLGEMHRVLRPGGLLLCSTPNIRHTSHPPYHIKEYRVDEFFELVCRAFGNVETHAQYFRVRDCARDRARFLRDRAMRFAVGHGLHLAAKKMLPAALVRSLRRPAPPSSDDAQELPRENPVPMPPAIPADRFYRVRHLEGRFLLRAMVAVATKEMS
ncbi:class I SAM-dependent methyltransferase [bacterium]|nr:class I SAM-dependent methyltransferase [bacterium]